MKQKNTPKRLGLTVQQMQVAEAYANGHTLDWILQVIYHITDQDDPKKRRNAVDRIRRTTEHPQFMEYYQKFVLRTVGLPAFGKAASKIAEQIDDPNGWLANKAANDILTRFEKPIMGTDSNSITVHFEGMPMLGEPDTEELESPAEGIRLIGEPEPVEEERE